MLLESQFQKLFKDILYTFFIKKIAIIVGNKVCTHDLHSQIQVVWKTTTLHHVQVFLPSFVIVLKLQIRMSECILKVESYHN